MKMNENIKDRIRTSISGFTLPRYQDIPNVGLYLEQVTKYLQEYLSCLQDGCITGSMISNYVKKGLVENPVKKQYGRDQIAYLFFIAMAKNVLSLDNIDRFIGLQKKTYTTEVAYNYFCTEFENVLQKIFGLDDTPEESTASFGDEKLMLRRTIVAIAHKIYLEKCFEAILSEENPGRD